MQLAIPKAPRKVPLRCVPGAIRRMALAALGGLAAVGLVAAAAAWAVRDAAAEYRFLSSADEVEGTVARVRLPPPDVQGEEVATLDVLYAYAGLRHSRSGVATDAAYASGLGRGATVSLLLHPSRPDAPREARYARGRAQVLWLLPGAVGVALLLAAAAFAYELRRTFKNEVAPLRQGALVWLTPDEPLPPSMHEVAFSGSYFRDDVKLTVRARGRPGRAPVRNGEKVLAAVVPGSPAHARVVDEDLARALGWVRG